MSFSFKTTIGGHVWYNTLVSTEKITSLANKVPREQWHNGLVICLASKDDERFFSYFDTYGDFFKYISKFQESHRNCFEVIAGELLQKMHFDIDISTESAEAAHIDIDLGAEQLLDQVITAIIKEYSALDVTLKLETDVMLFTSHGTKKRSFHIIVDNYCHADNKECELFFRRVIKHIQHPLLECVDASVYKSIQQFRLVGHQKFGSDRIKTLAKVWYYKGKMITLTIPDMKPELLEYYIFEHSLITNASYCKLVKSLQVNTKVKEYSSVLLTDDQVKAAFELVATKAGVTITDVRFPYKLGEVNGAIISLKRLTPSLCPVCNRVHEHENPYLVVTPEEVKFYCRRSTSPYIIGKLDLKIEQKVGDQVEEDEPTFYFGDEEIKVKKNKEVKVNPTKDTETEDLMAKLQAYKPSTIEKLPVKKAKDETFSEGFITQLVKSQDKPIKPKRKTLIGKLLTSK